MASDFVLSGSRPRVGVGGILVFLLILAGIGWAATSGPSFFGHASDEVKFLVSVKTNNCTSSSGLSCTAVCDPVVGKEVVAFSGNCVSDNPLSWTEIGAVSINSINDSWRCRNEAHTPGKALIATAICVQGGKDT
jgi:hypothetical protein